LHHQSPAVILDERGDGLELPVVELRVRPPDEGAETREGVVC
jgi:hypothetical protein